MNQSQMTLARIFAHAAEVDTGHVSPCWVTDYAQTTEGYARVKLRPDPSPKYVHRVVYEAMVGEIPDGLHLDHLCRNRACCNPYHLEPVTPAENVHRWAAALTRCKNGHEFSAGNVRINNRGHRDCRQCSNDRKRRARQREAA